jgi:hypothetical protein
MQISGKWLILFIFGTALAMAIFAWSFQYLRGRRVLELYGVDAARLIRVDADRIELLQLDASSTSNEFVKIGDQELPVVETIEISRVRGILHARQALIEDSSYDWNRSLADCTPNWVYVLRFSHGDRHASAAIDTNCRRLRLLETNAEAPLAEHLVRGMQTFVDEQLKVAEAKEKKATSP